MQGGNNNTNSFQDWKPVLLTKSSTQAPKTVLVDPNKTYGTFKNKPTKKERELSEATEPQAIKKMPRTVVSQLVAGRIAKNLKQKDLASMINVDIRVIQDIEANRADYDMALAQKIAGKLGIKIARQ